MRRRRSLHDSQAPSPEGSEDDEARSPLSPDGDSYFGLKTPPVRGRKGKSTSDLEDEKSEREALDVLH